MMELAIIPRTSIGPLLLGASRKEIRATLEAAGFLLESARATVDYFCEASISVSYVEETASFVGISFHSSYLCKYKGFNVFDIPAEELFKLMSDGEGEGIQHTFDDCGYIFPNQILSLWDADPQYDRLQGETRTIWAQVGLGDDRYAAAIAKIRKK